MTTFGSATISHERAADEAPLVTVIIPTFNRANFIVDAVQSVLNQTFNNFELIVVDDGSTDDTRIRLARLSDPRLTYVWQENKGRSSARNVALRLAVGTYIAFLDSDDLYLPDKLETQVGYLNGHPEVGMIYTSAYCIDQFGQRLPGNYRASVSGNIYKHIAFFRPVTITLPTVMVRKEIIHAAGPFDEAMERFEDTDMWRRIAKITPIHGIDVVTCALRTHADNELKGQNPEKISNSISYYSEKILKEDREYYGAKVRMGIASLNMYYAKAFATIPSWKTYSDDAWRIAIQYWPPAIINYYIHRAYWHYQSLNRIIRYGYFHTLNMMYRTYTRTRQLLHSKSSRNGAGKDDRHS